MCQIRNRIPKNFYLKEFIQRKITKFDFNKIGIGDLKLKKIKLKIIRGK